MGIKCSESLSGHESLSMPITETVGDILMVCRAVLRGWHPPPPHTHTHTSPRPLSLHPPPQSPSLHIVQALRAPYSQKPPSHRCSPAVAPRPSAPGATPPPPSCAHLTSLQLRWSFLTIPWLATDEANRSPVVWEHFVSRLDVSRLC